MRVAEEIPQATTPNRIRNDLLAGMLAGQVAGLAMAMTMMTVFRLLVGKPAPFPIQVIGSLVTGDRAVVDGHFHLQSFVVGFALHQLGPSLLWGLAFAALVHFFDARRLDQLLGVGIGIGVLAHVLDVDILAPPLFTGLQGQDLWSQNMPAAATWAAHAVYGVSLASFAYFRGFLGDER